MEIVIAALLVLGAFFILIASIGIVRLPDLYMRMSCNTKSVTLGVGILLLALALHFRDIGVATRALATLAFIALTVPISSHLIGRAAYRSGVELWSETIADELRGVFPKARPREVPGRRTDVRYPVLVTDYDGTLAEHGRVAAATFDALEQWRRTGRRLVLATGRHLEDLQGVCPRLDLFDYAVAENGALLFRPADGAIIPLAPPPPPGFIRRLAAAGVRHSVGRCIVATDLPWLAAVAEAILEAAPSLRVSLNKGAVMILPAGIDKGSGVREALQRMGFSPAQAVGIGDAENDESFLAACALAVAVADALESVRRLAARVTAGGAGAGVAELIAQLLSEDI